MIEFKQAIIVRKDLGMSVGKIAGQVAHASIIAADKTRNSHYEWYHKWLWEDDPPQTKIILKVWSLEELMKYEDIVRPALITGVEHSRIYDAGKTQIGAGTRTALGIGPAPTELIDSIVKDLKLL
jgi:PTH2 family peptidyl-tRNA hydrolase